MHRSVLSRGFAFLLLLSLALPVLAQQPAAKPPAKSQPRQAKQYTIQQFMDTLRIGGASFSPDEKQVAYSSNKSGVFNVYVEPASGGEATQLTHLKDSTFVVSYFPHDTRLLYTHDQGGNENNHLYVLEKDGSERDLTPGDKLKARFLGWSGDKAAFYLGTNQRDPKFFDIFRVAADGYQSTLVYKDETGYELGAISKDGKWLAFDKSNTTLDSDIFLYNTGTQEMKHITQHAGAVSFSAQDFDPASRYLYFLTDQGSEFKYVARYELASGKVEPADKEDWDAMYTYFSENGKYRVVAFNEDAQTHMKVYEYATGKPMPLPRLPQGQITSVRISPSERLMAFYFNGDRSPNDLYVYDFASRKVTKLTNSLNPEIDAADLVDAEVVRFQSFDGMVIPNVLYKPQGASAQHPVPALVWVHGGPGGQSRRGYGALQQYLVNHGYAVLAINNRGSSGYGKQFFAADDQKHGREPLWDTVAAKKYLQSQPWVDKQKIGILGGSYGGYMVLAALAFQPDAFNAGVDLFGVSNWLRTLNSIPPYWESFRKALYQEIGDPGKQEQMLRDVSPLFHADKIKKPLMVLQGKNDPRVIKPESDEIVAAVKKNGVPVEYVVFDDEGHGFSKKKNEIEANEKILKFLDQYLKGIPPAPAAAH
jgi:dipeptidyl aminopeptidase/acylaminoacyl peptidase